MESNIKPNPKLIFPLVIGMLSIPLGNSCRAGEPGELALLEASIESTVPASVSLDQAKLSALLDSHQQLAGPGVVVSFHEEDRSVDFSDLAGSIVRVSLDEIEKSAPPNLS